MTNSSSFPLVCMIKIILSFLGSKKNSLLSNQSDNEKEAGAA
jgi:hypothetical protein